MNEYVYCGFRTATCFTSLPKFHTSPIVKASKITDSGKREREREMKRHPNKSDVCWILARASGGRRRGKVIW